MKILIATGIFTPEVGGPATYIPNIAEEFLKLGHQPIVLTYSDNDQYPSDQTLPYQVMRIKRTSKWSNYWRYYKNLKIWAKNYDIIYAFDHFSAGLPAALVAKVTGKPLYIRVGGDFIWERYLERTNDLIIMRKFYENGLHLRAEKLRFKLCQFVFRQAKNIIFTTDFQKDIFARYYDLNPQKLSLVSNPINIIEAADRKNISREIVFAGRFVNKNNIISLIEAFRQIKNNTYQLVLIGEGPLKNKLLDMTKDVPNIRIEPSLTRQDLRARITKAYLVVFPSLTDISPNAMLECLAGGVPFVSSQEIGFDWLAAKVKFFNPTDSQSLVAVLEELADPEKYNNYSKELSAIHYAYSYSQAAADTMRIFNN